MKGRIVQIEENKYKIQVRAFLVWVDLIYDSPKYNKGIGGRRCIYATIQQAEEELLDYLYSPYKKFKPKVIKIVK